MVLNSVIYVLILSVCLLLKKNCKKNLQSKQTKKKAHYFELLRWQIVYFLQKVSNRGFCVVKILLRVGFINFRHFHSPWPWIFLNRFYWKSFLCHLNKLYSKILLIIFSRNKVSFRNIKMFKSVEIVLNFKYSCNKLLTFPGLNILSLKLLQQNCGVCLWKARLN